MTATPVLHLTGYGPSVYARVVRITLAHLGLDCACSEVDPFAEPASLHPMGYVPILRTGDDVIYETAAITRYLDRLAGCQLTTADPLSAARMDQVIAIVDAYAYRPLVRQVYAHAVFRPKSGVPSNPGILREGLEAAPRILEMLEEIAREGRVLSGSRTLADCHLAPMLAAFAQAPNGAALLDEVPHLAEWVAGLSAWPAFHATRADP